MIRPIRALRRWLTLRALKRRFLAKTATGRAIFMAVPANVSADGVWLGATEAWSPRREVARVGPGALELSDEETALRELKPMLADFHRAMAAAFRQFDAGLLAPMTTTHRWHMQGGDACQVCAAEYARTFGPVGERFGIRSFRLDTDTAEYKIYNPHPARALTAA
jgi:hypothetical protein